MIRVVKQLTTPVETKSPVIVVISANGLMTIDGIQKNRPKNRLLPACGIHEVLNYVPFQIHATNFSKWPVTLPKNMLIVASTERSEAIISYEELPSTLSPPKAEVKAVH